MLLSLLLKYRLGLLQKHQLLKSSRLKRSQKRKNKSRRNSLKLSLKPNKLKKFRKNLQSLKSNQKFYPKTRSMTAGTLFSEEELVVLINPILSLFEYII
jgi:hypothetical protein